MGDAISGMKSLLIGKFVNQLIIQYLCPLKQKDMSTAILHAEINTIDIPIIRVLLEKFKAKKVVFEEETYVPNEVTLQAMKEVEQMRRDKNLTLPKSF